MVVKNKKKGGNKKTTTSNETYVPSVKQIETNQVNKITNEALKFIHMDGFINSMNPSFSKKKSLTKSNKLSSKGGKKRKSRKSKRGISK